MAEPAVAQSPVRRIGRYDLHHEIASGGMATVYLARQVGATGFTRPVAVKRLHDNLATDPQFVSMLLDEARVAARVRHPNVVATLDVVEEDREVVLVMEYVHGESLQTLRKLAAERGTPIPPRIAASIVAGALHGLHAAHEATDELGAPLHIVHRDVSPQNILVGVDGVPRVLDFGIAKAAGRMQTTQDGALKGKFGYMAPEQLKQGEVTGRADVYAAAVVLWEVLAGRRLYPEAADAAAILTKILFEEVPKASTVATNLPPGADDVIMRGLAKEPAARYATALEMAQEVERVFGVASAQEVAAYVKDIAKDAIQEKSETLATVERADTEGGQKRRREVVARVAAAATGDDAPPRRTALWIVALVALGGVAVGVALARRERGGTKGPADPVASTSVSTTASGAPPSTSTPAPAVSASVASPVSTGASTEAADAGSAATPTGSSAPVTSVQIAPIGPAKGKGPRKGPDKRGDGPPTATATTPTAPTVTAAPSASSDEGRELIPKFRK